MPRSLAGALALVAVAVAVSACVPEPVVSETPGATSTSTSQPDATPLPSESAAPVDTDRPQALEISLPATCDALYSSAMRQTLDAGHAPLNDPGVTLASTQIDALRQLIDSGVPTLRCTWGTAAGTNALSTNVTIVDVADAPRIQDLLAANGATCTDASGGILCTTAGESHFLRGNGWVASSASGELVAGYTEDIAASLWG